MTFRLRKKALFKKLNKIQAYERDMVTHFSGKKKEYASFALLQPHQIAALSSESETDSESEHETLFYSWECVSLVRKHGTTLDLVIKN